MAEPSSAEQRMQRVVQIALFTGVVCSCAFLLLGALLYFHHKSAVPAVAPGVKELFRTLLDFNGVDIAYVGLLVLMITPVVRMIVLVFGFSQERDWRFVWISLVVLAGLLISGIYSIG